jgi:hypothetical protein
MPVSEGLHLAARRVCAGASFSGGALLLVVWSTAYRMQPAQSPVPSPPSLSQVLLDSTLQVRRPVLSSLAQTSQLDAEACDCSAPRPCVEIIETDFSKKLPGGGAAGLKAYDWGAWDPVTGVPRIGCPDTVTHAHCKSTQHATTPVRVARELHVFCAKASYECLLLGSRA